MLALKQCMPVRNFVQFLLVLHRITISLDIKTLREQGDCSFLLSCTNLEPSLWRQNLILIGLSLTLIIVHFYSSFELQISCSYLLQNWCHIFDLLLLAAHDLRVPTLTKRLAGWRGKVQMNINPKGNKEQGRDRTIYTHG